MQKRDMIVLHRNYGESKDAHISFDAMVPDERRGREKGAMRPISVGEEAFRSKGVGVNSVVGGLGLDIKMSKAIRWMLGTSNEHSTTMLILHKERL